MPFTPLRHCSKSISNRKMCFDGEAILTSELMRNNENRVVVKPMRCEECKNNFEKF